MRPPAKCHPDRPHKGHGLCSPCYQRRPVRPSASCQHTDRPARARGLCGSCYEAWLKVAKPPYHERNKRKQRAYYAEHQTEAVARSRDTYHNGPGRSRTWASNIRKKYGLAVAEFETMRLRQGGRCAVCRAPFAAQKRRPAVDHCHRTRKVRALLCTRCNSALGHAQDNPATLRKLADYVEAHRVKA